MEALRLACGGLFDVDEPGAMSPGEIRWRVHLASPPRVAYFLIATAAGRRRFWADSTRERDGVLELRFTDGRTLRGRVREREPFLRFALELAGGAVLAFDLASDGLGGTDLTLTETGIPAADRHDRDERRAAWAALLLALKAAADFGVDLRHHDPGRSRDRGYVDV